MIFIILCFFKQIGWEYGPIKIAKDNGVSLVKWALEANVVMQDLNCYTGYISDIIPY